MNPHKTQHRPYFIVSKISKEIRLIKECSAFTARERQALQKYVDDISGCIGSSERIVQTPGASSVCYVNCSSINLATVALLIRFCLKIHEGALMGRVDNS